MEKAKTKISRTVAVAGHYNPLHVGHLNLFKEARRLGDRLVVIVANDQQARNKRKNVFLPLGERVEIIRHIDYVDDVYISVDSDTNVCKTLEMVLPDVFAMGCDEKHKDAVEERKTCEKLGISIEYNVGKSKVRSSSEILKNYVENNTSK